MNLGNISKATVWKEMRARMSWVLSLIALTGITGCQSYEPRPLEPAAHQAMWHARTLMDRTLQEFVDRLGPSDGAEVVRFNPKDGLTLQEGELVALAWNPALRIARLRAVKTETMAEHAGLLPDPEFSLSLLRITGSASNPWIVSPGLTFSIPLSGRVQAEQGRADAAHRAEEGRVLESEWLVLSQLRHSWAVWSASTHRAEETTLLLELMEALVRTTSRQADAGELNRTEASLFVVERAKLSNQLRSMRIKIAFQEQQLRAQLGIPPEAHVELVSSLQAGDPVGDGALSLILTRNPTLARMREEYEVAEASLKREICKQYPDLQIGPAYESDEGQSRIGFLGAIPVPIFNANRKEIAKARVNRELARVMFETEYEQIAGRLAAASARQKGLAEQRRDITDVLVPLLDRQLGDAERLMKLGEGTTLVLLESLKIAHEVKLDLIATRLEETIVRTEIDFLIGPYPGSSEDHQEEAP